MSVLNTFTVFDSPTSSIFHSACGS